MRPQEVTASKNEIFWTEEMKPCFEELKICFRVAACLYGVIGGCVYWTKS